MLLALALLSAPALAAPPLPIRMTAAEHDIDDLQARVAALEALLAHASLDDDGNLVIRGSLFVDGGNLHVQDGTGATYSESGAGNGLGNVIIGYDEDNGDEKSGSHNLVVGPYHSYAFAGNVVGGYDNAVSATAAAVLGGYGNQVGGDQSVALGGTYLTVDGYHSAAIGGNMNSVSGPNSVSLGGFSIDLDGDNSVTVAGFDNTLSSDNAAIVAGDHHHLSGSWAAILGGSAHDVSGTSAVAAGGDHATVAGTDASTFGGSGASTSTDGQSLFDGWTIDELLDEAEAAWTAALADLYTLLGL